MGITVSNEELIGGNNNQGIKLTLSDINKELDLLIKKKQSKEVQSLFSKGQKLQVKNISNKIFDKPLLQIPNKIIDDPKITNHKNFFGIDHKFSFKKIN